MGTFEEHVNEATSKHEAVAFKKLEKIAVERLEKYAENSSYHLHEYQVAISRMENDGEYSIRVKFHYDHFDLDSKVFSEGISMFTFTSNVDYQCVN